MHLADLGATVWKIEAVGHTEERRGIGPMVDGINTYFFSVNRGKNSIQIDLKTDKGRELALSLAEKADVLTENFSPGTMEKLGLDYEAVKARNPSITYASLSGLARRDLSPPGRQRHHHPGHVRHHEHHRLPRWPAGATRYSIGDLAAGLFFSLRHPRRDRRETAQRQGQHDVSMLSRRSTCLKTPSSVTCNRRATKRTGTSHQLAVPFQVFTTRILVTLAYATGLLCAFLDRDN
jgi:hypothetical protein